MKKVFLFIILLLFPITVFGLVSPSSEIFVTDEADILSQETEEYIMNYSKFLWDSKKIDYYVVTVKNLEDMSLDQYADYVYEAFSINPKGILIFFSKEERMLKIIVGEQLGNIIEDETIDEYINSYFMPNFKSENWDMGMKNGYSSFYKLLCNYYGIDSDIMEVYDDVDFYTKYKTPILFVIIWIGTILSYVFCKYFKRIYKTNRVYIGDQFFFVITLFVNILLLVLSYMIDARSVLIVLGFEIVTVISTFATPGKNELQVVSYYNEESKKKIRTTKIPSSNNENNKGKKKVEKRQKK